MLGHHCLIEVSQVFLLGLCMNSSLVVAWAIMYELKLG